MNPNYPRGGYLPLLRGFKFAKKTGQSDNNDIGNSIQYTSPE